MLGNAHYKVLVEKESLEQENKELKEKVKSRENELANMAEQANMRINTYRSALEEIRKIAEDVESASSIRFYRIKNKINNVLNS